MTVLHAMKIIGTVTKPPRDELSTAPCSRAPCRDRQGGMALLVMLTALAMGGLSLFIGQLNSAQFTASRAQVTATALAQAKDALIGRAATDDNRPGSLPCPDMNNDGIAELLAGNICPGYIGRLPWKTLRLPELLDGEGNGLWYALSPGLTDNGASHPINPNKPLELTLDGSPNIAAIVFSPGSALASQNGRPSNNVSDYLDGSNSDGDNSYTSPPRSAFFNDTALAISRDQIFRTVSMRVLGEIRGPDDNSPNLPVYGLRHFFQAKGTFPWADSDADGIGNPGTLSGRLPFNDLSFRPDTTSWLVLNNWFDLVNYQQTSANSVTVSIGDRTMIVIPCPSSPCQ